MIAPGARLGLAVSGGPDSLALLLLAAAALPNAIYAATVDHGLRKDSSGEAAMVGQICEVLGVQHVILRIDWPEQLSSNLQAAARERRYALLAEWAKDNRLNALATAHHADDQAETLLMRLARGSGITGLGGVRPVRTLIQDVDLIRPLLAWRRVDLHGVVEAAGLTPVDDPSNRDDRFDRTAARKLLASEKWLQPDRIAASASHCRDADAALAWSAAREWTARAHWHGETLLVHMEDLPSDLKRRLLLRAIAEIGGWEPSGPDLMSAIDRLDAGEVTTLSGVKFRGGSTWHLSLAPPRTPRRGA